MQTKTSTDNLQTIPESVTLNPESIKKPQHAQKATTIDDINNPENGVPSIIKSGGSFYSEPVSKQFKCNKNIYDGHKREKMNQNIVSQYFKDEKDYVNQKIPHISTNWCNFTNGIEVVNAYRDLLGVFFGDNKLKGSFKLGNTEQTLTPLKLRVDCQLFHGCDTLVEGAESMRSSKEVYFNNNIEFNELIEFNLKYCQLPEKTRLAFDIILIVQEKQ